MYDYLITRWRPIHITCMFLHKSCHYFSVFLLIWTFTEIMTYKYVFSGLKLLVILVNHQDNNLRISVSGLNLLLILVNHWNNDLQNNTTSGRSSTDNFVKSAQPLVGSPVNHLYCMQTTIMTGKIGTQMALTLHAAAPSSNCIWDSDILFHK